MKKLLTVTVFVLITGICFGQKKDSVVQITDSTLFISIKDVVKFENYLKDKFTVTQFDVIMNGMNQVVQQAAAEYHRKNKPKK